MRPRVASYLAVLFVAVGLVTSATAAPRGAPAGLPAAQLTTAGRHAEAEPNGTPATATPITPGVTRAYIYPAGDQDYFAFTAAAGDRVYAMTMTSASTGQTDSTLELFGPDGTTLLELDADDGVFGGTASSIAGASLPAAGTYYLRVRGATGTSQIRPYDLYLTLQGGAPTAEVEPNGTAAAANSLPAAGWVSGAIAAAGDIDVYSLALNAGDTVFASLDLDPERDAATWNGRLALGPFNNTNLQVNDTTVVAPNSEALPITVKDAGTYYLYVDVASGGGATFTYNLSVAVLPAPAPAGTCTTYTSTAVPVTIPTGPAVVSSTITIPDDVRIADLDVSLTLTHTFMADLDMLLTTPGGSSISLFSDVGSAAAGQQIEMDLRLDDDAALPINAFVVMRGIVVQPESSARLEWFEGIAAAGTWTLQLYDDATADGGTLQGWSLRVCAEPEAPLSCPAGTQAAVVYSSDFEADGGGFSSSGTQNEWERGTPSFGAITSCASGTSCWKTDLDNTYNVSSNQNLTSPAIDLTEYVGAARVSWAQRYQMESASFDHAWVEVRNSDDSNPTRLWEWLNGTMTAPVGSPQTTVSSAAGWGVRTADISAYLGGSVELNAHLDSDTSVQLAGLAIDDVTVTACEVIPADLELTKLASPASAAPGETVTYTLSYTNSGVLLATSAVVTDAVDLSRLTDVAFTSDPALTADPGDPYTWQLGSLAAGASGTITVTGVVRADAPLGPFTNSAGITSALSESSAANNLGSADVTIVAPELAIAKGVDDATPAPGQTITYTLAISHTAASTAAAHDLVVSDTLPAGLSYVPGSASPAPASVSGQTIVFSIAGLALGADASITYQAAVADLPAVALGAALANSATLEWSSTAGENPDELVDTATAGATVTVSGADLAISKSVDPLSAAPPKGTALRPGQPLTYTLTFSNAGNLPASGVTISDSIPAALVDVAFTSSGAVITDTGALPGYLWEVEDLAPGAGGTITVTGRIDPGLNEDLTFLNTAEISGAGDVRAGNDSAGAESSVVAPRISLSAAGYSVVEAGAATITVTLDAPNPYAPAAVFYSSSAGTATEGADYTLAGGQLTIPAGATSATFSVATLADSLPEGSETLTLTLGDPTGALLGATVEATLTILDDDSPGVLVAPTELSVAEGGATAGYSVRLLSQPTATVTITPTGGAQLGLSPASLTFTPANWATPQTVTVTAVDDAAVEGPHSASVSHTATSGDTGYSGIAIEIVAVTIADNDSAPPAAAKVFLPLLSNQVGVTLGPDLVVERLSVAGEQVEIVIRNRGDTAVTSPFWVDLYIAPGAAPTAANQTWQLLGDKGAAWGVTGAALPLGPGESLTLRVGDSLFSPGESRLGGPVAAGAPVYAQVDSAADGSAVGAVLESHERAGGAYNNIVGATAQAATAAGRPAKAGAAPAQGGPALPARPASPR